MKLVVGLGNPGLEYKNTRHNIGFELLDYIAHKKGLEFNKKEFNASYVVTRIDGERVVLIKPLSYMNLSGEVVKKYVDYFKLDINDVLVIHDDLDMNFGRIKIVKNSSSGGHNGVKDIERNLKSKDYTRLKIGIGKSSVMETSDFVLSKFNKDEIGELNKLYESLIDILDDFCLISSQRLMNKYNSKNGKISD